jgi:hypothetical protein
MTKSIAVPTLVCALLAGGRLAHAGEGHVEPELSAEAPRLISEEALHDGTAVRLTYDNGVVVVAGAGSRVEFTRQLTTDNAGKTVVTGEVAIIPPPVSSAKEMEERAAAYRAAGRSPFADALAAGYPLEAAAQLPGGPNAIPPKEGDAPIVPMVGELYDSGCVGDTAGSRIRWDGCFRRYRTSDADPNASYRADASGASGEGSFWNSLLMGRTEHRYGSGKQIVQNKPTADRSDTDCTTLTLSGTYYGVSLSVPFQACFGFYDMIWATTRFSNEWRDSYGSEGTTVSVAAETWARVPNGQSDGFSYHIAWRYDGF